MAILESLEVHQVTRFQVGYYSNGEVGNSTAYPRAGNRTAKLPSWATCLLQWWLQWDDYNDF